MSLDYRYLTNRYYFKGKLNALHAIHVGSGFEGDVVDSAFARSGGAPYLPGSSIRGALRSTIERILAALGRNSCVLYVPEMASLPATQQEVECLTVRKDLVKTLTENGSRGQERILARIEEHPAYQCDVCRLFGSPFIASKVKIADAFSGPDPPVNERYGTGINRETGTVQTGVLYSYEVVEKTTPFKFELIAENMTEGDLGVLSIGLLEMLTGDFWVGAKSAAGLGRCQLRLDSIKYLDSTTLAKYLLAKKEEKHKALHNITNIEAKLSQWAKAYLG